MFLFNDKMDPEAHQNQMALEIALSFLIYNA
jgi:hypothetical protein